MAAMIEVDDLTKWYGPTLALDAASFTVEEGQIVGFLGPNGAGKSTTLRILTAFMPATSGRAVVAGHDVFHESLEVRRAIGYMPENVPLYTEMRVEEYLAFRARLKGVAGGEVRGAVDGVIDRCRLGDVRRRLVNQLSKGYRQRVGLADALVADPPVLVLDEPTIGLDPSQIQEVRRLIQRLGERHTVILSSHILPEVERTCSHLVIIAQGRIVAAGSVEDLRSQAGGRVTAEVAGGETGPAEIGRLAEGIAGVESVRREDAGGGWTRLVLTPKADADVREPLAALVKQRGWRLRELHSQAPSLEELYLEVVAGDTARTEEAAA